MSETRTENRRSRETEVIHGAYQPEPVTGAVIAPVFQTTAFAYQTAEELEAVFAGRSPGYVYSRIANPTVMQFEARITVLEDGLGAVACASGMAAIAAAALALAGAGDEIVSSSSLFGGTYSLFRRTLSRWGITTRFVEAVDPAAYRAAINDRTKLIFLETIGNPKLDVPDLAAISAIAREVGVVLTVDNTVATPLLCQPKARGADLVIHSTSKFINGHGNSIGGIIVDSGSFDWSNPRYGHLAPLYQRAGKLALLAYLRNQVCRDLGCCLSPFNAFLMSIGVESLAVRMERHCANAAALARFLEGHPRAGEVRYPGLPGHPDHQTARRQFRGRYGALLTLKLESKEECFRFINNLKLVQNLANLGDARTLVIHPASTICRDLAEEERRAAGVSDDLVRISLGIEHPDDIIADIEASLADL